MEANECHYEKKSIFKYRCFMCWSSICQFVKRLQTIRYGTDALTLIRLLCFLVILVRPFQVFFYVTRPREGRFSAFILKT